MTPATIIREAQADGVRLALSPAGTIKATGKSAAVNRWLTVISDSKPGIIEALKLGAGHTATASRWWLIQYPDRDPVEVACCPEATHTEILELHPDAIAAEPFSPSIRQPSSPLTASNEAAVRAWLVLIGETDPETLSEVIERCQRDADARVYFTGRAEAELPKTASRPDDRRTRGQCANLSSDACGAAKNGELVVSKNHEPESTQPRRCEADLPGPNDPDRRLGVER